MSLKGPSRTEPYDEVYPGILLGDFSLAKNKLKLKRLGVTHVVNCAHGLGSNKINTDHKFFADVGIHFFGIQGLDAPFFDLTPHFAPAADFIDTCLNAGGKVYVHCWAGVSRSATIVLAYLMLKKGLQLNEAQKIVSSKRFIYPNEGFKKQLRHLNCQLQQCQTTTRASNDKNS